MCGCGLFALSHPLGACRVVACCTHDLHALRMKNGRKRAIRNGHTQPRPIGQTAQRPTSSQPATVLDRTPTQPRVTRDSNSRCHPSLFCMSWCVLSLSSGGHAGQNVAPGSPRSAAAKALKPKTRSAEPTAEHRRPQLLPGLCHAWPGTQMWDNSQRVARAAGVPN